MWIRPRLVCDEGQWQCRWASVFRQPSRVKGRGDGLFAKVPLKKGTRIDYYGVRLTREMWDAREDQAYCVEIHGSPYELVDAHPSWNAEWTPALQAFMPKLPASASLMQMPADMMMGGLVNEPVQGESVNLRICGDDTDAFFETTRNVEADEELLTLYGEGYVRDYPSPYEWIHAQ